MSSLTLLSIIVHYCILQTKSEWICDEDERKCICEYGSCTMFGKIDYVQYICANTAESCTIYCNDEHSCAQSNVYLMATENAEIVCNGKDSCTNSNIYCQETNMKSCHIKINQYGMKDGYIKCDDNIFQCNVEIISDAHQIAMQRSTFECSSSKCQLNGCHHNQCLQSHMHCTDSSCLCNGNDCESNIKIHTLLNGETPLNHRISNRHLLQLNSTTSTSHKTQSTESSDVLLPDFTLMEYIVIAVSLVFCCGTCAIFIVICYCQRLKHHVIKRYRTSQSIQHQNKNALYNNSNESSVNTSNMNSNSNCDSCQSVSIEIQDGDSSNAASITKPQQDTNNVNNKTNPVPTQQLQESNIKTESALAMTAAPQTATNKPQQPTIYVYDAKNVAFDIQNALYPQDVDNTVRYHSHGAQDTNLLKLVQHSHPAFSIESLPSCAAPNASIDEAHVCIDQNGVQHHHHVYYVANPAESPYALQFSSQFPSSGPSLPYSPTTTYHHHEAQAPQAVTGSQSQCVTALINGHHPTQTLQIPNNKVQFPPKSSSLMSNASTLTSVTSTRYDVLPACLAPTSCSSDISVDSSNGSIYVCRFEDSFARRSSFKDILGVFSQPGSQPTQRTTNSKDFQLKGLCDTILNDENDEQSNAVRAVLPDMMDAEKSLSETPEPHALAWNDSNKDEQCIAQLLTDVESLPPVNE